MTPVYITFARFVNRKTVRCAAPFLPPILRVEYSLIKLINFYMHSWLSINQNLQILENKKIIKRHHRLAYLDLLIHNNTFKPFIVTRKLLKKILNLSLRRIRELLEFLIAIGLLKRNYCTWHNGERDIPNSITLQLVPPLSLMYDNSPLTFQARFQTIDSVQGHYGESKYVWVGDVYNDRHQLDGGLQRIGMLTEQEVQFFESLEEGDYVFIEAQIESFDEKDPYKIKELKKPTKIWIAN